MCVKLGQKTVKISQLNSMDVTAIFEIPRADTSEFKNSTGTQPTFWQKLWEFTHIAILVAMPRHAFWALLKGGGG